MTAALCLARYIRNFVLIDGGDSRADRKTRLATDRTEIGSRYFDPFAVAPGAIRFKPILLTALAAMIGAAVILADPIFHGLAISLLFGLASSTLLTVLVIPAIYVVLRGKEGGAPPSDTPRIRYTGFSFACSGSARLSRRALSY